METELDVVKDKIRKLLFDSGFEPFWVVVESPPNEMPPELRGRIHACCQPEDAPNRSVWIDASIFSKWLRVCIWDADTGQEVSDRFRGDDVIEKMLEFIKNKLPDFQSADEE